MKAVIHASLDPQDRFAAVKLLDRDQVEEFEQRVLVNVNGWVGLNEVGWARNILG